MQWPWQIAGAKLSWATMVEGILDAVVAPSLAHRIISARKVKVRGTGKDPGRNKLCNNEAANGSKNTLAKRSNPVAGVVYARRIGTAGTRTQQLLKHRQE